MPPESGNGIYLIPLDDLSIGGQDFNLRVIERVLPRELWHRYGEGTTSKEMFSRAKNKNKNNISIYFEARDDSAAQLGLCFGMGSQCYKHLKSINNENRKGIFFITYGLVVTVGLFL